MNSVLRRVRTIAPAKINWTLEVLGKREDGYHEIRSVMLTIDLCDEVAVEEGGRGKEEEWRVQAGSATLAVQNNHKATEEDLTLRAVRAMEEVTGRQLPVAVSLVKRIPVGAGLGGGSSDAAAVLRCVNRLHALGFSTEELAAIGAGIGSDVPFFSYGGTALVEGRGERVTPLRDVEQSWFVLLVPPAAPASKTAAMYASLATGDFSHGTATDDAVKAIRAHRKVVEWDIHNAFERAAYQTFADLEKYREAIMDGGARAAYLAGCGPGLFAILPDQDRAREIADAIKAGGGKVILARTIEADAATAVTD